MVFEQMSSETVSQRMARAALIYSGEQDGLFDRTLQSVIAEGKKTKTD